MNFLILLNNLVENCSKTLAVNTKMFYWHGNVVPKTNPANNVQTFRMHCLKNNLLSVCLLNSWGCWNILIDQGHVIRTLIQKPQSATVLGYPTPPSAHSKFPARVPERPGPDSTRCCGVQGVDGPTEAEFGPSFCVSSHCVTPVELIALSGPVFAPMEWSWQQRPTWGQISECLHFQICP